MDPLPRILFHGTTAYLAEAIERHGLRPRDGRGPHVTGDPQRARRYGVRCSCLALLEGTDPSNHLDLANLPPAVLVVVTAPASALLRDPACAGDYWLTDPGAATVRLEAFDCRPFIHSVSEAVTFARYMLKARELEDTYGKARQSAAAEGRPLGDGEKPPRQRAIPIGNGPPTIARVEAAPPSTGMSLGRAVRVSRPGEGRQTTGQDHQRGGTGGRNELNRFEPQATP